MLRETRQLMGMPITVEVVDAAVTQKDIDDVYAYFTHVDEVFSTYKDTSEISRINRDEIAPEAYSSEIQEVFRLSEETKNLTNGYFNIQKPDGSIDPSGLVKGWAIWNAAKLLEQKGFKDFYVDAGGDVQVEGKNATGESWRVGIKNPFNEKEIVKALSVSDKGVATSGTYIRGQHIYDPNTGAPANEIVSLTVIGPNIYEADRFATAAFAMGKKGVEFIEQLEGFEGYSIDATGTATLTSHFEDFVLR